MIQYFQPIMPPPVEAPRHNPHVPKLAPGFFAKERIIAPAEFNRWLVPPAALAIHLCIGMAYGFSVFWLPLSQAIGVNEAGQPTLVVFVDQNGPSHKDVVLALPPLLRGIPVRSHLTDKIRAFGGKPGGGSVFVSHTARQSTPIYLGTSGGWRYDAANGYCCAGTLGSLIQVNGVQYILSNYHVFEADIVPGGNNLVSATGQSIIQPGLIDVQCDASQAAVSR